MLQAHETPSLVRFADSSSVSPRGCPARHRRAPIQSHPAPATLPRPLNKLKPCIASSPSQTFTATASWGRNLLRRSARGHIDIPRLAEGNVSIQAFTVVTTAPRNLNIYQNSDSTDLVRYIAIFEGWPPRTWNSPKQRALYQAERLRKLCRPVQRRARHRPLELGLEQFLTTRNSATPSPVFWAPRARSPWRASWKILTTSTPPASA